MTTPTLTPPRRPTGTELPRPMVRYSAPAAVRYAHHARASKVWRWSLGVSVLLHLFVLVLSPLFLRVGAPPGDGQRRAESPGFTGMQMIDPAQLPDYQPVTPPIAMPTPSDVGRADGTQPPRPESWRGPGTVAPGAPRPEGAPARGEGEAGTRDNPLRPGLRDPRLWIAPREVEKMEPSQEELHAEYMAGLERRLRGWNDSIAGEADRARRATDWTVRDRDGRRWGVSPDGIHLGGVTLPPTTFPPGGGDPDKRARAEQQERDRRDIDRQQADADRRRAQQESIRATRERRERERSGTRSDP